MFFQIMNGNADSLKIQSFLDKVNLPYNNLVFIDDSGSMSNYINKLKEKKIHKI